MHILIGLALACGLLATGTAHAQWSIRTAPLSEGWTTHQATGPNGQSAHGTTAPLSDGWSTTTWTDDRGNISHCTTAPLSEGYSTTRCQ